MLVQDRKTGRWYDPKEQMDELMEAPWFIEQMKRMKDGSFDKGYAKGLADSLNKSNDD